jgi:hypothetical protein
MSETLRSGSEPEAGRPLWRTVMFVLLASLALHRGAAAYMAFDGGLGTGMAAGLALQSLFALATALGILLGRRWVLGMVVALGASLVGTALTVGLAQGAAAAFPALSASLVLGLGCAGLYLFLRHELAPERASGAGPAAGPGPDPGADRSVPASGADRPSEEGAARERAGPSS